MDIEGMDTAAIYAALIERLEYESDRCFHDGIDQYSAAKRDRIDAAIARLNDSLAVYKREIRVQRF